MSLAYEPSAPINRSAAYVGPLPPKRVKPIPPDRHKSKQLNFQPRVRMIGTVYWLCPACGSINRSRLTPQSGWHLKCLVNKQCGAIFKCGWTLWQQPAGGTLPPLDEPFPLSAAEYLGRGRYIHSAVPLEDTDEPTVSP